MELELELDEAGGGEEAARGYSTGEVAAAGRKASVAGASSSSSTIVCGIIASCSTAWAEAASWMGSAMAEV